MTPRKLSKSQKSMGNEKRQEFLSKSEKDSRTRPATSGKQSGLIRSERVFYDDQESLESGESIVCPSSAPEPRRPVDVVVVDVHNENKGLEAGKLFKRRTVAQEQSPKIESSQRSQRRSKDLEQGSAWEIQESIDAIDEFEETSRVFSFAVDSGRMIERMEDTGRNLGDSNSAGESYPQLFGSSDKFVRNSGENSTTERETDMRVTGEPKRRRKRWSKNEDLQLTKELVQNSSDTNLSTQSETRFSTASRTRPVPAPRRKALPKSFARESTLAFDNAGFKSDPEEVLRIETEVYEHQGTPDGSKNYRKSTKIEMTNVYDSYEEVEDRETRVSDSEEESGGSLSGRSDEIETVETQEFANSSDELETEVRRVKKGGDKSQVLFDPKSHRRQSAFESSELTEDQEEANAKVSSERRGERGKRKKKNRLMSKGESTSFDTGNSLTDISDLPRSKTRTEFNSSKSKSKKHRSKKRGAKNESENDLREYKTDREEKFISVTVHKADVLETDFITRHPMVKVHIVDMKTGNYLKTANGDNYGRCSYLQPLITGKFDFKENRSIVPNWEEELIFEYNFEDVVQPGVDKPVLFLFEILDLLSFAEASFKYNLLGNEGCWHKIAWAFLRPIGVNGILHINKKLRLQLYEPPKTSKKSARLSKCEVFNWWRLPVKEKYPSTLYVTLKSVDPPIQEPIVYERLSFNELAEIEEESRGSCKKSSDLLQLPKWSRLAAQSCKIPNDYLFQTETFENGSFHITFSNNGKYLACVGSEEGHYPIVVYSIPEGKKCAQFNGHANFVYSLSWSNDDKYLLSVSSDQTACIWDMGNRIIQQIHMLPHPSYVYCGKFYPGTNNVVVTGCYDCAARVWTKCKSSKRYELTQELYEHKGYVNSICFQKDGGMITADSVGAIVLWSLKKRGPSVAREWRVLKTIKNNEIENVVINTVVLHPLGSRLLVHSRDNVLRMIDLETGVVLQRYKGLRNRRLQTTACLSPCGGLVFCGGEDSCLTVWSLESGKRLANYLIREAKIVACVAYHPLDHILAFSTFGSVSAAQILIFEKNSTGENVGLSLLVDNEAVEDSDDVEITVKFDKNDLSGSFGAKYFAKKSANSSKRGERFASELNRSYGTSRKPLIETSKEGMSENSLSRQELLRLKIQRLNESEEGLKSRSAVRLNNIIEKIDRILVNTTSKKDLDSTWSSNDTRRQDMAQISSNSRKASLAKSRDKAGSRSWKSRSRERGSTSNTDVTMEPFNTSAEFIEMQNIGIARNEASENEDLTDSNRIPMRLKSRAGTTANISLRSDVESEEERFVYKSSGESHRRISQNENKLDERSDAEVEVNSDRKKPGKRRKRRGEGRRLSSLLDEKAVHDTETCIIDLENIKDCLRSNPSTSDSAGTYTIDKEKLGQSWTQDKNKATDTSSSVGSNATFIIENEILKVRRKSADRE